MPTNLSLPSQMILQTLQGLQFGGRPECVPYGPPNRRTTGRYHRFDPVPRAVLHAELFAVLFDDDRNGRKNPSIQNLRKYDQDGALDELETRGLLESIPSWSIQNVRYKLSHSNGMVVAVEGWPNDEEPPEGVAIEKGYHIRLFIWHSSGRPDTPNPLCCPVHSQLIVDDDHPIRTIRLTAAGLVVLDTLSTREENHASSKGFVSLAEKHGKLPDRDESSKDCCHGPDFRSVRWFGIDYTFTTTQAACVNLLWKAYENGTPEVGWETIMDEAGSGRNRGDGRLLDLFRGHPAWKTMIISGRTKGSVRLANLAPEKK